MIQLPIPGIVLTPSPQVLWLSSQEPLDCLSSALVGGGLNRTRHILNMHVDKDYAGPDPVSDLESCAHQVGIQEGFIGLMTAVMLEKVKIDWQQQDGLGVCAIVTAGLANASAAGISAPAGPQPGTINTILLIDGILTPAALVNAVITATEAKCAVLRRLDTRTPDGHPATGTSTDAIVVASTNRGPSVPYAGPLTLAGWLLARAVGGALEQACA